VRLSDFWGIQEQTDDAVENWKIVACARRADLKVQKVVAALSEFLVVVSDQKCLLPCLKVVVVLSAAHFSSNARMRY
jgi:hypothetical protein